MRIGIDLRSVEGGAQHRGIGRYVSDLLETISEVDHANEYFFLLSGKNATPPKLKLQKGFKYEFIFGPGVGARGIKYIRLAFVLPRPISIDHFKLDVLFQPDFMYRIKPSRTPIVSVIHDLIPFVFEDMYQKTIKLDRFSPNHINAYTRNRYFWRSLFATLQNYRRSSRIVSISEHSKQDLLRFVPSLNPENIRVIGLGTSKLPEPSKTTPKSLSKLKLKRYFFYIGGADPRKGLVALVRFMEEVWQKHPDIQLVLAGKELIDTEVPETKKLIATIKNLSQPDKIIRLGRIDDAELSYLHANAVGHVFPSRYEGFGISTLEAMQAKCPVVTYANSSIPEVAGDAAILVDDGESLAPAMIQLIENPRLREELTKKGVKRAKEFTWHNSATAILELLREASKEKMQK